MGDTLDDLPQPAHKGTVDPESLETDGDNPNEMSDEQFGLLCDRMRQNGWLGGPIITNTDGLIADGQHRWQAAQEIGLTEVPVKQYEIDDATRRLWRQELNKIHGEHDTKRDALEYDYLLDNGKTDEVQALTNAADEDLDELLAEIKMDSSRPAMYEYDPDHNVYFEDCVEGMRERVEDDSVDAVITDPPYGVDMERAWLVDQSTTDSHTVESDGDLGEALDLFRDVLTEAQRVLKPDGHLYVFTRWDVYPRFYDLISEFYDPMNCLVWNKNTHGSGDHRLYAPKHELCIFAGDADQYRPLNGGRDTDVIDHPRAESDGAAEHPTKKPVGLVERLMEKSSDPGDRILDPFMGSGTTAVAAIQNDREYVGFEVDAENYRDVIERRIGEAKRQRDAGVNKVNADD